MMVSARIGPIPGTVFRNLVLRAQLDSVLDGFFQDLDLAISAVHDRQIGFER